MPKFGLGFFHFCLAFSGTPNEEEFHLSPFFL